MEKIITEDLESLNTQEYENAKRELTECFASSKLKLEFLNFSRVRDDENLESNLRCFAS